MMPAFVSIPPPAQGQPLLLVLMAPAPRHHSSAPLSTAMADLSPRWAQALAERSMLQTCIVKIEPVRSLAQADLPRF